jgi:hypothetical protein
MVLFARYRSKSHSQPYAGVVEQILVQRRISEPSLDRYSQYVVQFKTVDAFEHHTADGETIVVVIVY